MEPLRRWLTTKQAAEYLGYSEHSIKRARFKNRLGGREAPPFHKIGTAVRYDLSELDEWVRGE